MPEFKNHNLSSLTISAATCNHELQFPLNNTLFCIQKLCKSQQSRGKGEFEKGNYSLPDMDELSLMHAFRKHCSLCSEILVHIPFILITFSFFIPAPHQPAAPLSEKAEIRRCLSPICQHVIIPKHSDRSNPTLKCLSPKWHSRSMQGARGKIHHTVTKYQEGNERQIP